jgi:hypothetical protein
MSLTITNPKCVIDGQQIDYTSITYTQKSTKKVAELVISTTDLSIQERKLLNKEVTFFLNHGTTDSVPYFRGFVRDVIPTSKGVTVKCRNVLTFLTGTESERVVFNDLNNYDGHTISQFLHSYITDFVNIGGKTLIGLDMLNDTTPPVTLSGFRNEEPMAAMDVVNAKPVRNTDLVWSTSEKDNSVLPYFLDVEDDGVKSNIMFKKEPSVRDNDARPAISFSFKEGIISSSIKMRPRINSVNLLNEDLGTRTTLKTKDYRDGLITETIEDVKYPDAGREEAHYIILNSEVKRKEITLNVTKGHYLPLGSLIQIKDRTDSRLRGYHNLVGKKIDVSGKKLSLTLYLNTPRPEYSDWH